MDHTEEICSSGICILARVLINEMLVHIVEFKFAPMKSQTFNSKTCKL